jgi:hypothetical protein
MRPTVAVAVVTLALSAGCGRQDAQLERHKKNFESLGATTKVVSEAWLSGHVSGTYTRTSLEQTFYLVEQERATLASTPAMLQDPRGAALSQDAEHLSRLIASIIGDVTSADGHSVRQRLTTLPILPQRRP